MSPPVLITCFNSLSPSTRITCRRSLAVAAHAASHLALLPKPIDKGWEGVARGPEEGAFCEGVQARLCSGVRREGGGVSCYGRMTQWNLFVKLVGHYGWKRRCISAQACCLGCKRSASPLRCRRRVCESYHLCYYTVFGASTAHTAAVWFAVVVALPLSAVPLF